MPEIILTLQCRAGSKTWLAYLSGLSRKYGLCRDFVSALGGKPVTGEASYLLAEEGFYEVCEAGQRRFIRCHDDGIEKVERFVVLKGFLEVKKKLDKEIEEGLGRVRFTQEGGWEASEN